MAAQWGTNSLAPGASQGWFFARANTSGFLPVLQVMPLSPSFTDNLWFVSGDGYPSWNELGVSTVWSQLSNDLSTVLWFMVVENNSNNTIEYAFLEADQFGPGNAPTPNSGLGSNSNYFLYSPDAQNNCTALQNLTVTINVTQAIVGSDGFSFQLNAYSASGDVDGAQQYVITVNPSGQVFFAVDNWQDVNGQLSQLINDFVPVANLSNATVPVGYTMTIALQNDAAGNVSGANYSIVDDNGNPIANSGINLLSLNLVGGGPVTTADLAPIVAFQLDFVDWANGGTTTLSSGAGTITYTCSNPMTVTNTEPGCVDWDYVTVETANSIYGPLPTGSSQTLVQSFATALSGAVIHKTATVMHKTTSTSNAVRATPRQN